jgi:hypothetical protein
MWSSQAYPMSGASLRPRPRRSTATTRLSPRLSSSHVYYCAHSPIPGTTTPKPAIIEHMKTNVYIADGDGHVDNQQTSNSSRRATASASTPSATSVIG